MVKLEKILLIVFVLLMVYVIPSEASSVDASITSVHEGEVAQLTVNVTNVGGGDYLTVKPTSSYWYFTPVDDNTKFLRNGERVSFVFRALALSVPADMCGLPVNILADGSDPYGGDATGTVYGCILHRNSAEQTSRLPGFQAGYALAGLIAVAYFIQKYKRR